LVQYSTERASWMLMRDTSSGGDVFSSAKVPSSLSR
jgi:hypothetical protein